MSHKSPYSQIIVTREKETVRHVLGWIVRLISRKGLRRRLDFLKQKWHVTLGGQCQFTFENGISSGGSKSYFWRLQWSAWTTVLMGEKYWGNLRSSNLFNTLYASAWEIFRYDWGNCLSVYWATNDSGVEMITACVRACLHVLVGSFVDYFVNACVRIYTALTVHRVDVL